MRKSRFFALAALLAVAAAHSSFAASSSREAAPSMRINPHATPAEYNSIRAYLRGVKNRTKALDFEERAAAADSEKARAKYEKKARKEFAKAIDQQSKAVELDNQNYKAFNELGFAMLKTGELEKAVGAYRYALTLNPKYYEAWHHLGEVFLRLGRINDTKRSYMELFSGDRDLADELMESMQAWLDERGESPSREEIEFADWLEGRKRLARLSRDLSYNGTKR